MKHIMYKEHRNKEHRNTQETNKQTTMQMNTVTCQAHLTGHARGNLGWVKAGVMCICVV